MLLGTLYRTEQLGWTGGFTIRYGTEHDRHAKSTSNRQRSFSRYFEKHYAARPDGPFAGECVRTLDAGIKRVRKKCIWAAFVNLSLPDSQVLQTFLKLSLAAPDVPTLVLGGAQDEQIALEALRQGAKDYLLEGRIDSYSFVRAIRNMAERKPAEETLFTEKERTKKAFGRPLAEVFEIIDGGTQKPSPNPLKLAIQENKTVGLSRLFTQRSHRRTGVTRKNMSVSGQSFLRSSE